MIEVELPDGRILAFPEGTSRETMRAAIQKLEGQDATMSDGLEVLSDMTSSPQVLNNETPNRSLMHKIADNVVGIDDGVMSPGEKLAELLNTSGESMTFGLVGDEADAMLRSSTGMRGDYDTILQQNRDKQAQLRDENPYLAVTADVLGGIAVPAGVMARSTGLLGKMMLGSASAGAAGGTYGYMEGETPESRREGALWGGAVGAGLGAAATLVGRGAEGLINRLRTGRAVRSAARNAPDADQLATNARALFQEVDAQSVPADGLPSLANRVATQGRSSGMDEMLTPNAVRVSRNLTELAEGSDGVLPMSELNILRRQAQVPAGNLSNRTESAVGSQMIEAMDQFVDEIAPALGEKGVEARRMWGVLRRSELIENAIERAKTAASGFENGLQAEFRRILRTPKLLQGFSEAERQAIGSVVNGGVLHGLLRQAGRLGYSLDGGSNALGGGMGLAFGGLLGGWPGAILTTGLGSAARKGSELLRTSKANRAAAFIRTLDQPNVPMVTPTGRGLIDEMLVRASRSTAMQSAQ